MLRSLIERIPRAVIEAMSRGILVLASDVGGISQMLGADWLVLRGDPDARAWRIAGLVDNPDQLARMSGRSFEGSKPHWPQALGAAERVFWVHVVQSAW